MESMLVKKYYRNFLLMIIVSIPITVLLVVFAAVYWVKYANGEEVLFFSLLSSCLAVIFAALSVRMLYPYIKDFSAVRNKEWIETTGLVVGIKEVHSSCDPPTTEYCPVLKLSDGDEEVILNVDGMEQGKKYKFIYLPHTKLAIIIEREK